MGQKSKKQSQLQLMQKLSALLQKENFSFGPVLEEREEYLLFDATSRLMLLRFVSLLSIACAVVMTFITLRMTEESMIQYLGNIAAGRWLQAGLILISCIFLFLVVWLSGKYVLKVILKNNGVIEITTWRLALPHKAHLFNRTDFQLSPIYNEGRLAIPFRPVVEAPYYVIRPRGKKMILDEQGKFPLGEGILLEAVRDQLTEPI